MRCQAHVYVLLIGVFSLVIKVNHATSEQTLLFDSGTKGGTVEINSGRHGIDFSAINAAMFSHGHWDHVGGIISALQLINKANEGNSVPLHVNEGVFINRDMRREDNSINSFEAVPSKKSLEAAEAKIISNEQSLTVLNDNSYISGEIPRVTPYEKGLTPHVKDIDDGWEPDPWIMG